MQAHADAQAHSDFIAIEFALDIVAAIAIALARSPGVKARCTCSICEYNTGWCPNMYGGDSTVARVGRASDTAHHVRANSTRMRMCSARGIAKRRSKRILTVRNRRAVEYLIEGLLGCKEEDRNSDRERISKTVVRLIGRCWLEMNLHVRHYFARAGTYASHCNCRSISLECN